MIYSFFFVRKVIAHTVTFFFYCVVLPATVLVPEVEVPKWGSVYIPSIITLLNAVGTPRSFSPLQYSLFWQASFHDVLLWIALVLARPSDLSKFTISVVLMGYGLAVITLQDCAKSKPD